MSLAPYVRIVARGQGRARSLTLDEAREAMGLMLRGTDPEAVGALLMVLRLRGETDAEIAGFTAALRDHAPRLPPADLDWPCYAAGRTRGAPFFLLAARLVARSGYRVSMHGWNGREDALRVALPLAGPGVTYAPLETLSPAAFRLLRLRDVLGLRSCVNTVLRMWNPSRARASVQGVFHPSYRGLQARAAELLGDRDLMVIKGGGGEFERNPAKACTLFGLSGGAHVEEAAPALLEETRRLHEPEEEPDLAALWQDRARDPFAEAVVTGTAALALHALHHGPDLAACEAAARDLWAARHHSEEIPA
jgi:anthranilate phosphoribosyltransferase